MAVIDYLCNAFVPSRASTWRGVLGSANVRFARTEDGSDTLVDPAEMVERMDRLGIQTLLLPTGDIGAHGREDPFDFAHVINRWSETEALANAWPGRFLALATVDPTQGARGARGLKQRLQEGWVAGAYVHTHSWDRDLDHADYYPHYWACGEAGVPVAMQVGVSGGRMPSACGRPITINRPGLYFPEVQFVLSHTGWPWVEEAIAMALKLDNVHLGTASYPPRHWPSALLDFIRGPGAHTVLFGSNFPLVDHDRALRQVDELGLPASVRHALLEGNARSVFTRVPADVGP